MNDSPEPRTIVLLGTPFHDVSLPEALERVTRLVSAKSPAYVLFANLDCVNQVSTDIELQRILIEADLVLCENSLLVWTSRLTGHPLRKRVSSQALLLGLAAHAAQHAWKLFLLGDDPDGVRQAAQNLVSRQNRLQISGHYIAPCAPLHEFHHAEMAARIREAAPDILIVALDCPKQEKWIRSNYRELGVPCIIGVGSGLDILTGHPAHIPRWAGVPGAMSLYRFIREPGRRLRMCLLDARYLLRQSIRERRAIRNFPQPTDLGENFPSQNPENVEVVFWKGEMVTGALKQVHNPTFTKSFIVDMSLVTHIDSDGINWVLKTLRKAWSLGITGCLAAPSKQILDVFIAARLERVLPMASSMAGAHAMIRREHSGAFLRPIVDFEDNSMLLILPARIVNENAQNCAASVLKEWQRRSELTILRLDLSSTTFIDSSGLGFLIRCNRMTTERPGAKLELLRVPSNVRNVLRVSKLDNLLHILD